MTAFEVVEYVVQLFGGGVGIEPKYPVNDMVGTNLVCGIEVAGLSCRLERSDDDPCRVRAQI